MAKLRHIAMVVEEMEKTAQFYEKAFGMKRVRQHETAIGLSDGVVSLVIIHPSNVNMKGDDRRGLHHRAPGRPARLLYRRRVADRDGGDHPERGGNRPHVPGRSRSAHPGREANSRPLAGHRSAGTGDPRA